jgi:hypothetical protein
MPKGRWVKLPSQKHVPDFQYGHKRIPSSVPGPGVGMQKGGAVIRSAPQRPVLGALSRFIKAIDEQALAPTQRALGRIPLGFTGGASEYTSGQREGLAGMLVPRLGNLGQVLEEASYGMPLTTGRGMTTGIKPEVGMAALEAAQLPPVAKAGALGARLLGRTAKEQLPAMAARLAEKYPLTAGAATPMYAVKPQGGQWMPRSAQSFAEDVVGYGPSVKSPYVEEFANKAIPKYIERYMGAEGDPLADVLIPHGREMKRWEELTDPLLRSEDIASVLDMVKRYGYAKGESAAPEWMQKLDPQTKLWKLKQESSGQSPVKNYVAHVLEHAQTIPPEKLKQYDFPRLVKEVQKIDAEKAKKMASVEGRMEGTVPHKEYPTGYKWVEVQSPEALKREGDIMGHCVGGYCEDVKAGRTKIYSLRDPKGESHATVELRPPENIQSTLMRMSPEEYTEFNREAVKLGGEKWGYPEIEEFYKSKYGELPHDIRQIKGKQNLAPKKEYLPYVQDLIRSGKWGEIRDLGNTGLMEVERFKGLPNRYKALKEQYGKYVSDEELNKWLDLASEQGKRKGGHVNCKGGGHCGCLKCLKRNFADGGAVIRNIPQNRFLGALARAAKYVDESALEPAQRALGRLPIGFTGGASEYTSGQREGLAGMLVPRLGSLGNVLEEASYGMPLTTGKGMTTGIKPEVGMAALEAAQLPPVARAGVAGARALGRTAQEQLPAMAAKLAEKYPLATAGATPLYAVKPQGGQWLPGSAREFIKENLPEDSARRFPGWVQPHEEWAEKAIPKYIEKYMGAEGDPLADVLIPHGQEMKRWEELTDPIIKTTTAGAARSNSFRSFKIPEWMEKLDPQATMYGIEPGSNASVKDYISHVLEHAETIPPEKLKQYDFPRLVKEVQKIDAEKAKKMSSVEGRMEGTVPHKEYPTGYKWVEVQSPEALKREGDIMGHCVGSYCESVKAGKMKIYSLRDPKGESHATVEVTGPDPGKLMRALDARNLYYKASNQMAGGKHPTPEQLLEFSKENAPDLYEKYSAPQPYSINQIKGKQNLAPKAEYQPYVQDFVKSGNWGEIRDIHHTGLRRTTDVFNPNELKVLESKGAGSLPKFLTKEEIDKLQSMFPSGGKKKGGSVMHGESCGCLKCLKRNFAAGGNVAPYLRKVSLNPEAEGALGAVSQVESSDNPNAIGPQTRFGRARGKFQILPSTAKDLDIDPMHPKQAEGGAHLYLSWLIGQTGSLKDALAAYNMGLGNFKKRKGTLPKETENYVTKIMALLAKHKAGVAPTVASAPVNPLDTTPQPDPATTEEDSLETPMPDQIASGPVGGGGGKLPAMSNYGKISGPPQGSIGTRNPSEMISALLKDPLSLSRGE